jgi:hypothetical protein
VGVGIGVGGGTSDGRGVSVATGVDTLWGGCGRSSQAVRPAARVRTIESFVKRNALDIVSLLSDDRICSRRASGDHRARPVFSAAPTAPPAEKTQNVELRSTFSATTLDRSGHFVLLMRRAQAREAIARWLWQR